ncbi:MAG TPA: ABC transporter permease [Acidimicrobiales bacterium]|nr:ABC transporter permease [Acidimicrobiales bacterium]
MAVDERVLTQQLAGLDALEDTGDGRSSTVRGVWRQLWPKMAALGLALALWQLVVATGWRPEYVLPAPTTVFAELGGIVTTGSFWQGVGVTARRAAVGFGLAVLVGGLVGALVATLRPLRVAVGALITGLQTMPSIAWFPLAILLFKLSESAITFVVVLGAAPSIANGLIGGIDHVPPILVRAGRMLGAKGPTLFRHVILPAAMPSCLAGLKQGWAFAWRSLMAGELIVLLGVPSIGARLQAGREFSDAPLLLAMMIVVLIIGIVIDAVFGVADARLRQRRGLVDTAT